MGILENLLLKKNTTRKDLIINDTRFDTNGALIIPKGNVISMVNLYIV